MKRLGLIVEIKEEEYDYRNKGSYNNLLQEVKKEYPLITQLLIDVKSKRIYCYSNNDNPENNLIA